MIRWRFEGATMHAQKDGSIQFTKAADIPRKANTVQITLFKIPPPEYIDANHKIIHTGIRHTLKNNQLALNLDTNSSLHFPLWVDPTMVSNVDAKGSIPGDFKVGRIRDFNNDGFDDAFALENGKVNIYFGEALPSASPLVPDVIISRSDRDFHQNINIASAGDFNGDGFGDLMIGEEQDDSNGADSGTVFIFFGQNPSSQLNLDALTQANITITGSNADDRFGSSLDSLGNFEGVGSDDIVIIAVGKNIPGSNNSPREGAAYIFRGQNTATPITLDAETDADRILNGIPDDERIRVAKSAGDFNGDGKGDLIFRRTDVDLNRGDAQIFSGSVSGSTLQLDLIKEIGGFLEYNAMGDFNNDGFDDIIVFEETDSTLGDDCREFRNDDTVRADILLGHANGQPSPGTVGLRPCDGQTFNGQIGNYTFDINGDGFDDAIVSREQEDAVVFLGRSEIPTDFLWDELDGAYIIEGNLRFMRNGGDFDNDGADEIVINGLGSESSTFFFHSFPANRPVITLNGDSTVNLPLGVPYADAGATASDNEDGDITGNIVVNGLPINTGVLGSNLITYDVTDSDGNAAVQVVRTVNVVQTDPPSNVTGFQDGSLPNGSYSGTEDSYLVQRSPSANFGSETIIQADGVQFDPASGKYGEVAAIIKWDVSSIPVGAQVSRVFITFNYTDASSGDYNIYSQNTAWTEGSVSWGDMNQGATLLGVIPSFTFDVGPIELNPDGVALVQDWVDGSVPNNGLIIRTAGSNNGIQMESSESSGFRPKLDIIFVDDSTPGPGLNKNNLYTESCNTSGQSGQTSVTADCFCRDFLDVPLTANCSGPANAGVALVENKVSLSDPSGIAKATCTWNKNSSDTSTYTAEALCFNVNNN